MTTNRLRLLGVERTEPFIYDERRKSCANDFKCLFLTSRPVQKDAVVGSFESKNRKKCISDGSVLIMLIELVAIE